MAPSDAVRTIADLGEPTSTPALGSQYAPLRPAGPSILLIGCGQVVATRQRRAGLTGASSMLWNHR
jgi:hypothetical protein